MKIATAAEMQEIDRKAIQEAGIAGLVLMERAGLAVVSRIKELYGRRKVVVLAGAGNNGGDGLVVARNLHNLGWDVQVFLTAKPEDVKGEAHSHYTSALQNGVIMRPVEAFLSSPVSKHSLVIDALFGTGLRKNISGILSQVISGINRSSLQVLAVDIPSGISSDSGQVMGNAVRAACTVTFGLPKRGHFLHPGAEYTGKLFIEDIGFPEALLRSEEIGLELIEKRDVIQLIPRRKTCSHKGNYGHVLIVAGSRGKTGAALMAARACLRTGAGLVTLGVPASLADVFQCRVTEEMLLLLPDDGNGILSAKASGTILDFLDSRADILAIGPGIGVSSDTKRLLTDLVRNSRSPVIIDADGIHSLAGNRAVLKKARAPLILTPHPGEMAGLLREGRSTKMASETARRSILDAIESDRINKAVSFARENRTCLVLKGVPTVIATPEGRAFLNPTGNPGMATAGSGDVLTGMIAGFLGQTGKPLDSCILGVYMHGLAGDSAASGKGLHSLIATDIIDTIPAVFLSLEKEQENPVQ